MVTVDWWIRFLVTYKIPNAMIDRSNSNVGSIVTNATPSHTVNRYFNNFVSDAKNIVDSACKCMFGLAPSEMSLLYFLMYIKAAGGLQVFLHPREYTGGECRIKVNYFMKLVTPHVQ